MIETLAIVGGVLLLLAISGGIEGIASKWLNKNEFVPLGDRIAAVLLGWALIGLAAVVGSGSQHLALWLTLGIGAAIVAGYALFLWREYRRTRQPTQQNTSDVGADDRGARRA